jgi:hypothetical protein
VALLDRGTRKSEICGEKKTMEEQIKLQAASIAPEEYKKQTGQHIYKEFKQINC